MITNSVDAQVSRELIVKDGRFAGVSRRIISTTLSEPESGKPSLTASLKYAWSEYVWAHLMLFITMAATAGRALAHPQPLTFRLKGVIKRGLDIIGSVVGLILCSPFFVILPILIKLDSPGPVFYRQVRVGHNRRRRERRHAGVSMLSRSRRERRRSDIKGQPFQVIKFRTMVADAEKKCGPVWATKNDPRVTRLGRFMRKSRLDEIPQFINVLLGDMSLVGPRPERPMFVEKLSLQVADYERRLEVKPGLTGLAQVEHEYDSSVTSVSKKIQYDLNYIRTWSIWQDVRIMLKTVVVVITGKGAC